MPHLSNSPDPSCSSRLERGVRRATRRCMKSVMKSHRLRIPKYEMPIRLRPWFLVLTSLIMVLLAFLGFTEFAQSLPLNDSFWLYTQYTNIEILHFICLGVATGVFYFIWDVDEDARRIWIWRNAGLIFTGIVCFFFGGVVSEVVQSILPYKYFDVWDIVANLSGSTVGLWVSYHLERYYRHRREISRLYRPLSVDEDDIISDSESDIGINDGASRGLPLLPTHQSQKTPVHKNQNRGQIHLGNVWDEREELFGIGEDEDEDEESAAQRPSNDVQRSQAGRVKIMITGPD